MKLFKTNNMVTLCECVSYFNFKLPSVLLVSRYNKFVSKFNVCENYFCKLKRLMKSTGRSQRLSGEVRPGTTQISGARVASSQSANFRQ